MQWIVLICAVGSLTSLAAGHVFIAKYNRVGGYPKDPGEGWYVEVFLNLPDTAVHNSITAETYIAAVEPDFTFRTPWIDFPAGPEPFALDSDLSTVGDLLNDYIYDVSDPSKLAEPMSHMAIRFTGLLKSLISDEVRIREFYGMPTWIEFGVMAYDGDYVRVGDQICFETPDANLGDPWFNWGPAVQAQGLFPIEVLYFNRYDPQPDGEDDAPYAGIEVYSWHGGGMALPAGENMIHAERGPGTLVPPARIYQPGDELPVPPGDFDADGDVDFADFRWMQTCWYPPNGFIILPDGCETFDLAPDNDVDRDDLSDYVELMLGPE